jgi:hypothetical protein
LTSWLSFASLTEGRRGLAWDFLVIAITIFDPGRRQRRFGRTIFDHRFKPCPSRLIHVMQTEKLKGEM